MARLNPKAKKGLLALAAVVAVASLVFGATMQIVPLSVTGTATSGTPVSFTVAGDEAPWDTTIVMTGKTVTATATTWTWDGDANAAGDSGVHGVDYYFAHKNPGSITVATLASGTWESYYVSAAVNPLSVTSSAYPFRIYVCQPAATDCVENAGARVAVSGDLTVSTPNAANTLAFTFTSGGSALQGTAVDVRVVRFCPGASPNCADANFVAYGDSGVVRTVSQGSINPAVGSASYSGTLASGVSTSELPITLTLGANSLAVTATGSGKVDYLIDYEEGVKPVVSSVTISGGTITATASDANSDHGDSVTTYEFTLLKDGATEDTRTQTSNAFTFNSVPASYTVQVRAKDTRGVWSDTLSQAFTVSPTGSVQKGEQTTISAPAPETGAGGAVVSGASADVGDFTRRTVVGWIRLVRWVSGDGFTDPTRDELPDWIENLAYGAP